MVFSCFGLRIAAWNANGVRSRIVELRDFINKHSLDIILIQETHLRPGVSIRVPNYTLYRNDTQTQNIPSGDTAILIKSSLNLHHILTPTLGTVEATTVVLTPPGENPLLIAYIYIPPPPLRVHSRLGGNFRTRAFFHFMRRLQRSPYTLGLL
ncbi:hypothetical protein TNCV_4327101 [Trichonephila clavipes]|nr:hypothetical protein TNCV_4327101 [Trichonephila clavipes]